MSKKHLLTPLLALLLTVLAAISCAAAGQQWRFDAQLTAEEAALSSAMEAGFGAGKSSISFSLPTPRDCPEGVEEAARLLTLRAFEACCRDHPEFFWVGRSLSYTPTVAAENPQHMTGVEVTVQFPSLPSPLETARLALNDNVNKILSGLSGSDGAKIKALHDAITARCQYDQAAARSPASHPLSFEAYGALVDGKATCEGYAKAFKLLCDRVGIPCVLVSGLADGTNHMWNQVKVGDFWYLVDTTFDDPIGGEPNGGYLLKGKTAAVGHQPGDSLLVGFDPKFSIPALSESDYVLGAAGESAAQSQPKESCIVLLRSSGSGECTVRYVGNAGAVDPGQQVPGGIVLTVSALPDPGYALQEIQVKMGGVQLTEREKNSFCFSVTDDCAISVLFQRQEERMVTLP